MKRKIVAALVCMLGCVGLLSGCSIGDTESQTSSSMDVEEVDAAVVVDEDTETMDAYLSMVYLVNVYEDFSCDYLNQPYESILRVTGTWEDMEITYMVLTDNQEIEFDTINEILLAADMVGVTDEALVAEFEETYVREYGLNYDEYGSIDEIEKAEFIILGWRID